jgi:outer membrane protein assembly complex protein YaeT
VTEGNPIRVGEVVLSGFEVLPAGVVQALRDKLPIRPGDILSESAQTRAVDLATHVLQDAGYAYAHISVTREVDQSGPVRLSLTAAPGPMAFFGPIEIVGNLSVADDVIRRQLLYRPGELFRRTPIVESQRQVAMLQLFEFVTIEAVNVQQRPLDVPTRITVVEGDPQRLRFSGGYGTEEKLSIETAWQHLNFVGGAQVMDVRGKWSWLDRGVEARFTEPYLFRPDLSMRLEASHWDVDEQIFRTRSTGGQGSIQWSRNPRVSAMLSVVSEFTRTRISSEVGLDSNSGEQEGTLTALALDVERRTAADRFDPREGSSLVLHLEQAGGWLPGSFNYFNLLGEARYYHTVAGRLTLAERVRYASISPLWRTATVPFFRRYFLGGSTSLRGWGRLEVSPLSGTGVPVGGHTLFEGSSEVRVPLFAKLTGVVFLDAGNVWATDWRLDLGDLLFDAGAGLRYETPFGVARFDFAYQLNRLEGLRIDGEPENRRWRIHFSVGQAF